jgi:hypothetical protein
MRLITTLAAVMAVATPALGQSTALHVRLPPPTAQAEQKIAASQARFGPQSRAFAVSEGRRLAAGAPFDEASLRASIARANLGAGSDGDIMALAQLVMMQAAQEAADDLRAQMQAIKDGQKQRTALRGRAVVQGAGNLAAGQARPAPTLSVLDRPTRTSLNQQFNELKTEMDSLGDLSEEQSLRIQMYMDRYAKFMEMLSNMMKKASDTQAGIISNMK